MWTEYYAALEGVADLVMDVFARALELPSGFFVPYTDRHITALRALHYPPTAGGAEASVRCASASTATSAVITVLLTDGTPGLQVAATDDP